MAYLPPITPQLVRRFEDAMNALSQEAIRNVQALPGNPFGFDMAAWGRATGHAARQAAGAGWWNRAAGLESADESQLREILAFFSARVPRWYTRIPPGWLNEDIAQRLAACGLYPAEYETVLYGLAERPGRVDMTELSIREITPDEVDLFAELWAAGFELPAGLEREVAREIRKGWFVVPDNHCYIGYADGQPAAMAALYVHGGIGFLNVGATLPAYRRRGLHAALSVRRISDAAAAGCDLIIGHTGFGGQSQNNEERLGLRLAYTPVRWTKVS